MDSSYGTILEELFVKYKNLQLLCDNRKKLR